MEGKAMAHGRVLTSVLAAVAWVLVGIWGVVNLAQEDWFIGGVMLGCAFVGLWSLAVRVLRDRHGHGRRPGPRAGKPTG
jgi:hypothetical protein